MKIVNGILKDVSILDIQNGVLKIPEGVTRIEYHALRGYETWIKRIILPRSLKKIEAHFFEKCSNLEEVELQEGLEEIGTAAFIGCSTLSKIKLPSTLKKIGRAAFAATGIKEITIPGGIKIVSPAMFSRCNQLEKLILEDGITIVEETAFQDCSRLKKVILPNTLITIENRAFQNCDKLQTITFPESLESIEEYAFRDTGLIEIEIPEKMLEIKPGTFRSCQALEKIVFKGDVTKIDRNAFYFCTYLKDINFPESLTEIGECAFECCNSLTVLDFPKNLQKIGNYAFRNCHLVERIDLKENIKTIGKDAFKEVYTSKLLTSWGEYQEKKKKITDIEILYLYLFSNRLLKEKYNRIDDFLGNKDINLTLNGEDNCINILDGIQKFKNLFSKLRKQYNIKGSLFSTLALQTTEEFSYSTWKRIENIFFTYFQSYEMAEAFSEMIEVFGLFHKDKKTNERIEIFQNLLKETKYQFIELEYLGFLQYFEWSDFDQYCEIGDLRNYFHKQYERIYQLNDGIDIPEKFEMYLSPTKFLTLEERKKIKKITGSYGKKLNDFINENYKVTSVPIYTLNELGKSNSSLKQCLFELNNFRWLSKESLHDIFDGCKKEYNEDFYNFLMENLPFILKNSKVQTNMKDIQKNFEQIKKHYLRNAGSETITLKQALDYIENICFSYHEGNYEFACLAANAGVNNQTTFDYYQEVYETNQERKLSSLVKRSNIFEIDGFTIQAELLRKDDPYALLVGEKNYTNCCQRYQGVGHNCMAHATNSEDGGIFVTRLFKDGEWILLTQSWDWQNNNLYCHDNIEGTEYLKKSSNDLKKAVIKALQLDAEDIIKKSKEAVEKYNSSNEDKLEERQMIKVVTVGAGYDDLGLKYNLHRNIKINGESFEQDKRYSLNLFQPVNYDSSRPYFDSNLSAYSDAKEEQFILVGDIKELIPDSRMLEPIYRDERRIVKEEKEAIRDYTKNKIFQIEKAAYDERMCNHNPVEKLEDSAIYLGEDWYLIFEKRKDNSIYISDLARIDPTLEDEKGTQQDEIKNCVHHLIDSYNYIEADLKEDTSYLLYLMNKRLGIIEQIGEDISYPYEEEAKTKIVSSEEQQQILKQVRKIREEKNPNLIMHKVKFKKK